MSVGSRSLPERRDRDGGDGEGGVAAGEESSKRKAARYGRCFSGLELRVASGTLKDVDAGRLKDQIRKWAKAVVAYARQISFGSPRSTGRSRSRSASSPTSGAGDTPRSATFTATTKSGHLGGAKNEPPT